MFSKTSRYREVVDVLQIDHKGKVSKSKEIRLLPETPGEFRHTIEEVDRLDHLAQQYYENSQLWWLICDANPEFLFPLALLGKDAVITERFMLQFDYENITPPWSAVIRTVKKAAGVERMQIEESPRLVKESAEIDGKTVQIFREELARTIYVTYNHRSIDRSDLLEMIERLQEVNDSEGNTLQVGFLVESVQKIDRIGREIIIPPEGI